MTPVARRRSSSGSRTVSGVLVLDKPAGLSSATAVQAVKVLVGADRAGHGGTLDPLATGVLAVCLGAATKIAPYLLADDKAYEATGVLGVETDTLDRTGQVTAEHAGVVSREALLAAITGRRGEHDQVPPMYSAIKQGGVRLYHLARAGEEVERVARRVRIDHLELLAFEPPRFTIAVACSKGTYIRSLVADLGTDVGSGAHLAELRRTRSGRFSITQAITLAELEAIMAEPDPEAALAPRLVGLPDATDLPRVVVAAALWAPIKNGLQLPLVDLGAQDLQQFQVLGEDGRLLAVAHGEDGKVIYDRVFTEHMAPLTA